MYLSKSLLALVLLIGSVTVQAEPVTKLPFGFNMYKAVPAPLSWSDPAVEPALTARWGFLAQLPGHSFTAVIEPELKLSVSWEEPGKTMRFDAQYKGKPFEGWTHRVILDPASQQIRVDGDELYPDSFLADGSVFFGTGRWFRPGWYVMPEGDGIYLDDAMYSVHFKRSDPPESGALQASQPSRSNVPPTRPAAQAGASAAAKVANPPKSAAPNPVQPSVSAAASAAPSWGWLDGYIDKTFLHLDQKFRMYTEQNGSVLVYGRYKFRRAGTGGQLVAIASPDCETVGGVLRSSRSMVIECEEWTGTNRFVIEAEGEGFQETYYFKSSTGLNFLNDFEYVSASHWSPDTQANRELEAERTQRHREEQAIKAAEYAAEKRERDQAEREALAEGIGNLISGGSSDYERKEAEANAVQQRMLDGIAANARAAEARQQAERQRQQAQQQAEARAQQEQRLALLKQTQEDNARRADGNARQAAERQRQAEQDRRAQAAAEQQRQQQAAAEQERRRRLAEAEDAERRSAEAAARAESQRRAEESQRRAAEASQRQQKEQADRNHLSALRTRIQMGVKACGRDDVRVGGVLPRGSEDEAGKIAVHFTVYCPGNIGVKGTNFYFQGDGYSCVGSDMVQVTIPCEAKQARVILDSVTRPN